MIRALAVLCLMSVPASAQMMGQNQPCGPEEEVVARLIGKYGEQPMMRATLAASDGYSNGDMLLLGNPKTGTWTILSIKRGQACITLAGQSLTPMDPPERHPGI